MNIRMAEILIPCIWFNNRRKKHTKKQKKKKNHIKKTCLSIIKIPFALHFRRGDLHLDSVSSIPNTQGQKPLYKRTVSCDLLGITVSCSQQFLHCPSNSTPFIFLLFVPKTYIWTSLLMLTVIIMVIIMVSSKQLLFKKKKSLMYCK